MRDNLQRLLHTVSEDKVGRGGTWPAGFELAWLEKETSSVGFHWVGGFDGFALGIALHMTLQG